jgi:hypothetical protein
MHLHHRIDKVLGSVDGHNHLIVLQLPHLLIAALHHLLQLSADLLPSKHGQHGLTSVAPNMTCTSSGRIGTN